MTSNIDPRGVERGACNKADCDCESYEYNPASGRANCAYCDCAPPSHMKVGTGTTTARNLSSTFENLTTSASNSSFLSTSVETDSSLGITVLHVEPSVEKPDHANNSLENADVITLQPDKELLQSIMQSAETEPNSDEIPMPPELPDDLKDALQSRILNSKHRSALVRHVVGHLINNQKHSNKHLRVAARKIVKKYSPMKKLTDHGNDALYKKLMQCRNRKLKGSTYSRRPSQRNNATAAMSAKDAQEQMVSDWAQNKRSLTLMGPLLEATRAQRIKDAGKSKTLNLLVNYPALAIPSLLIREFEVMPDIAMTKAEMIDNWKRALPHFRRYFKDKQIYNIGPEFSESQQTVMVLENLHRISIWATKKSLENRAAKVLEVFAENTPIDEARPNAKDPVRMSAIGNAMGDLSIFTYCDTEPVFSTSDPIEAIVLLMATYWVFNLQFGSANKMPLLFMCACTLGTLKISKYIHRNERFLDLCRQFQLPV